MLIREDRAIAWLIPNTAEASMSFLSRLALVSRGLRHAIAISLILSLVAGCAVTAVPISAESEAIIMKVKPGDKRNIVTTNQRRLRFSVD